MTYTVVLAGQAEDQVATLPRAGLIAYMAAHVAIAVDPWAGESAGDDEDARMRTLAFGHGHGLAVYLVMDRDQRVFVVKVLWAG